MDAHEKRVKIRLIKLSEFSLISFDNWSQNEMDAMRMMELTNVAGDQKCGNSIDGVHLFLNDLPFKSYFCPYNGMPPHPLSVPTLKVSISSVVSFHTRYNYSNSIHSSI